MESLVFDKKPNLALLDVIELLGLVQHVTAYERLAAEAAVTRDLGTARKALLAHPLIGQHAMVDALAESTLAEAVS